MRSKLPVFPPQNMTPQTFNKEPGSGSLVLHTAGVFTLVVGSALLDAQGAELPIFLKCVSAREGQVKKDSEFMEPTTQHLYLLQNLLEALAGTSGGFLRVEGPTLCQTPSTSVPSNQSSLLLLLCFSHSVYRRQPSVMSQRAPTLCKLTPTPPSPSPVGCGLRYLFLSPSSNLEGRYDKEVSFNRKFANRGLNAFLR